MLLLFALMLTRATTAALPDLDGPHRIAAAAAAVVTSGLRVTTFAVGFGSARIDIRDADIGSASALGSTLFAAGELNGPAVGVRRFGCPAERGDRRLLGRRGSPRWVRPTSGGGPERQGSVRVAVRGLDDPGAQATFGLPVDAGRPVVVHVDVLGPVQQPLLTRGFRDFPHRPG